MSDVSYRIVGALGPGPASPLLADVVADAVVWDRVVLDRPGPGSLSADLRGLSSWRIVASRRVVATERGPFAVVDYVAGLDLDEVRARHGAALDADTVCMVLRQVVVALQLAATVGHHHGALRPSSVRIDPDGLVRVLGVRGGTESADVLAVHGLACALIEEDDGSVPERFAAEAWPDTLDALSAHLQGPDVALTSLAREPELTVYPHALAGSNLAERRSGTGPPAKVQIAAVGALTLVLGLGAGWALAGWSGGQAVVGSGDSVQMNCEVQGDLDDATAGRYLCVGDHGGLRCTER